METSKKKVLVIDDDYGVRMSVEMCLAKLYDVVEAGDAKEGLAIIQTYQPDLIITDYKMPGMSGLDLIRKINDEGNLIPILMMSASDIKEEALALGVKEFIDKPFDCAKLREIIEKYSTTEVQ